MLRFPFIRSVVLAVVIGAAVHGVAQAQVFPSKPIHLVVPFAPGGSSDVLARLLAKEIEPRVGQTILVENRAGAGGSVAAGYVAKAPADGHTILLVAAGHAGMSALYDKLPFDPVADFAPVIGLTTAPVVVAVNAQSRFKSLQDLVAAAKAEPGKLNCAGGGGGATVTNLAFELLKSELKLTITAVPYKGSAPALTALIGNEIDCDSDAAASVLPLVQSGRLRPSRKPCCPASTCRSGPVCWRPRARRLRSSIACIASSTPPWPCPRCRSDSRPWHRLRWVRIPPHSAAFSPARPGAGAA
ncbi:MAG: hypothetical protein RL468_386 [Pseudomonadota bacterium]